MTDTMVTISFRNLNVVSAIHNVEYNYLDVLRRLQLSGAFLVILRLCLIRTTEERRQLTDINLFEQLR